MGFLADACIAARLWDTGHVGLGPVAADQRVEFGADGLILRMVDEVDIFFGVIFQIVELMEIAFAVDIFPSVATHHALGGAIFVEFAENRVSQR